MTTTATPSKNGTRRLRLPADLRPEAITAIIDTREQTPLDLVPLGVVIDTLTTGDYSIRGLEDVVAVERKSLPDLLHCVGADRERFEREVMRLLAYPARCLIVESTWEEIEAGQWRGQVKPAAVVGSLLAWQSAGLPVLLAANHQRAGQYASRFLFIAAHRRWREARQFANTIITQEDTTDGI